MKRYTAVFSMLVAIYLVMFVFFPTSSQAHPGGRDELGGHFRSADCVYILHEPSDLAKSAHNVEELITLIKKYNSNETCKVGLSANKVDLEGYSFSGGSTTEGETTTTTTEQTTELSSELKLGKSYSATLVKCVDGDTANFNINGTVYKTRFLYIDTPESTNKIEPFGKEASEYTCSFLKQGNITLETDGNSLFDKYERLLAWVFVDGKLHQEEITKAGFVEDFYDYGNYKYEERIIEAMAFAKANYLGIYNANKPVSSETKNTTNKETTTSEKVTDTKDTPANTNDNHDDAEIDPEIRDNEENTETTEEPNNDDSGLGLGMVALLIVIIFFSLRLLRRR